MLSLANSARRKYYEVTSTFSLLQPYSCYDTTCQETDIYMQIYQSDLNITQVL